VVLVDDSLARLYASTQSEMSEFSAYDINCLNAIALARNMQVGAPLS
jgi:transcriptional accessory protein Tex/SPT6